MPALRKFVNELNKEVTIEVRDGGSESMVVTMEGHGSLAEWIITEREGKELFIALREHFEPQGDA